MVSLSRIAEVSHGDVQGNPDQEITQIQSLESATVDSIAFCVDPLRDPRFLACKAGAMILASKHADLFDGNKVLVDDPYLAYARISHLFKPDPKVSSDLYHLTAVIDDSVSFGSRVSVGALSTFDANSKVGDGVWVGKGVHIGENVTLGVNTVIHDGVVIGANSVIGNECTISAGAVIGSSGFGYAPDGVRWQKIEQLGAVSVGDWVDIGANTTIDRGAIGNTVIESGVKIDNLVQIAHNVHIGEGTIIAGCVGIAGSAKIGKRCKIAGKAAILGHLEIVDDVTILVNSLVTNSILESGEYGSMIPVQPIRRWRKNVSILHRLDKLNKKLSGSLSSK